MNSFYKLPSGISSESIDKSTTGLVYKKSRQKCDRISVDSRIASSNCFGYALFFAMQSDPKKTEDKHHPWKVVKAKYRA